LKDEDFWLKRGAFMEPPNSHATCFSCHSVGGGLKPEATDCATCHKLSPPDKLTEAQSDFDAKFAATMSVKDKTMLEKWSRRQAGRFRHEWFSHAELKCTDCHNVAEINTANGKGPVVNVLSCGGAGSGCHVTATSDDGGALNFEIDQRKAKPAFQCTKCHINEGRKPVPESHSKALIEIKKK
jgi:formate-dependent nitrite reductase cytochrome c552 subunit